VSLVFINRGIFAFLCCIIILGGCSKAGEKPDLDSVINGQGAISSTSGPSSSPVTTPVEYPKAVPDESPKEETSGLVQDEDLPPLYVAKESYGSEGYDHEDYVDVDNDIGYTSGIPYKGQIIAGFPADIPIPANPVDMTMRKSVIHGMTMYDVSFHVEMPLAEIVKIYRHHVKKTKYSDVEEELEEESFAISGMRGGGAFSMDSVQSITWDKHYYVNLTYLVLPELKSSLSEAGELYAKLTEAAKKVNSFAYKSKSVTITEMETSTGTSEGEVILRPAFAEHSIHTNRIEGEEFEQEVYIVNDTIYLMDSETGKWTAALRMEAIAGRERTEADWTVFFKESPRPAIAMISSVKRGNEIELSIKMDTALYSILVLKGGPDHELTQFDLKFMIDVNTWFPRSMNIKTSTNAAGSTYTSERSYTFESMNEIVSIRPPA